MAPGEIYIALFPFGGTVGNKRRPALALTGALGTVPEILVAYITSIVPATLLPTDIVLDPSKSEHGPTNLKTVSVVRLHKVATIHHLDLVRRLGTVSAQVQAEVDAKLRLLFNL